MGFYKRPRHRGIAKALDFFIKEIEAHFDLQFVLREGRSMVFQYQYGDAVIETVITGLIPPVNYELSGFIDGRLYVRRPCAFLSTYRRQGESAMYEFQEIRNVVMASEPITDPSILPKTENGYLEVKATANICPDGKLICSYNGWDEES